MHPGCRCDIKEVVQSLSRERTDRSESLVTSRSLGYIIPDAARPRNSVNEPYAEWGVDHAVGQGIFN